MIGKVKATGSVETSRTNVGTIIGQGATVSYTHLTLPTIA